jgi:beta-lactam-binding protein with PASTA domain
MYARHTSVHRLTILSKSHSPRRLSSAGLLVTFKEVDDPNAPEQRAIVGIEPPVGTFVARGSEVLVLISL